MENDEIIYLNNWISSIIIHVNVTNTLPLYQNIDIFIIRDLSIRNYYIRHLPHTFCTIKLLTFNYNLSRYIILLIGEYKIEMWSSGADSAVISTVWLLLQPRVSLLYTTVESIKEWREYTVNTCWGKDLKSGFQGRRKDSWLVFKLELFWTFESENKKKYTYYKSLKCFVDTILSGFRFIIFEFCLTYFP